jgi:hypothetical protein
MQKSYLAISIVALLSACGGDSGNSVQTGRFVDSAVSGINYQTATQQGTTDENGQFKFQAGETVTFSIGGVALPPVAASNLITPVEMGSTGDFSDAATVAVARFLQSVDADSNPENGIQVKADKISPNAVTPQKWSEAGATLTTLLANNVIPVSEAKAMEHLARRSAVERKDAIATLIGRYDPDTTKDKTEGVSEIIAYHEASKSVFITMDVDVQGQPIKSKSFARVPIGSLTGTSLSNPVSTANLTADAPVVVATDVDDDTFTAGGVQSLDISGNLLAIAVSNINKVQNGVIAFYEIASDGKTKFLKKVVVGVLPDGVAFSPDGSRLVVANEGELPKAFDPSSLDLAKSTDPEGSISIISITNGVPSNTAIQLTFSDFNTDGLRANELPAEFRVGRAGASVAQDAEPEYVAFSEDSKEVYVTLQENNAVAVVDLSGSEPRIAKIFALGYKDHGVERNALAPSDEVADAKTKSPTLRTVKNLFGVYMPDGIAGFTVNGKKYFVLANEGDDRNDFMAAETALLSTLTLDATAFPDAAAIQSDASAGRLTVFKSTGTGAFGDTDKDGDYDKVYALGGRSFSIIEAATGKQIFDSGSEIERIAYSNADLETDSTKRTALFKALSGRYDNKGPEPESVVIGKVRDQTYAFIGLERSSAVMVYNVSNPEKPRFVQYLRNTDNLSNGDISPEGLKFVPGNKSPTGKALLLVGYEVSGTMTVYQID